MYSTGGYGPNFVALENAKTYQSPNAVSHHLKLYARGQYPGEAQRIPATWEVVEFEVIHNQKWSNDAVGFLKIRKQARGSPAGKVLLEHVPPVVNRQLRRPR